MNDQTPLPAPGWYADPASPETTLRYWDGAGWTEHVHPLQPQAPDEAASAEADAAAGVAGSAPAEPAPDVAVPSAQGVDPSRFDTAETAEEPVAAPAAAQTDDVPSRATLDEPTPESESEPESEPERDAAQEPAPDAAESGAAPPPGASPAVSDPAAPAAAPQTERPDPYAEQQPYGQQPNPYAPQQPVPVQQQPVPYGQQAPANPYAPNAAATQHGPSAPQPPSAPWAQGAANPYQQPQPAQYGAQPGAPKSNKGLWIGLGIGGGVLLLLVIGIVVLISVVFAGLTSAVRDFEPAPLPSYDSEAPGDAAPEIEGEVYGMGETFVVPDLSGTGDGWEVTVTDFSAEAADAASAAPGNKAFAVLVEVTNLSGSAMDPYFAMTPTFVGSDGLEYTDYGMIEPGLFDLDNVDPGATAQFTATFEVPEGLEDTGTLLVYDGFMEQYFPVEVG